MSSSRLRLRQLLHLSWRDLWHERWLALCTACVLASTLAPLWTLWGLERGVIGTLIERQERDPVLRQIAPVGSGTSRLDDAWFARVSRWPEVSFVLPTVRKSAALVQVFSDTASRSFGLQASQSGDPLLGGAAPPTGDGIVLSDDAAKRLQVAPGQTLRIALNRTRNGIGEPLALTVRVAGVLPLSVSDGEEGFAAPQLLENIEAWRDGYTVAPFGPEGNGPPPPRTVYPLFRMHAASIRDVQLLAQRLQAEGISTRTHAQAIEATLGLQRNLRAVLAMVGGVTLAGAVVALAALQIATVRRKRREYALLKLTGHGRAWLVAMPCVHAIVVALIGALLAFVVYSGGAAAINAHFASHFDVGETAVNLRAADIGAGLLATVLISVLPALWGGWRASCVEAADELRDN